MCTSIFIIVQRERYGYLFKWSMVMLNLGSEFSEEAQNSCLINVMLSCKVTIAVTANSNNNINNNNKMLCVGKKACLVTDVPI